MILVTTLYNEKNEQRLYEYIKCISDNQKSSFFEEIYILYDTENGINENIISQIQNTKTHVNQISKRPEFCDFFYFSKKNIRHEKIICVANCDIFFDKTIEKINKIDMQNKLIVLTRYEKNILLHKSLGKSGSADVWIYKNPIIYFKSDFMVGVSRCDGRLSYEAKLSGINVINPCLSIKTHHLHDSNILNSQRGNPIYENGIWEDIEFSCLKEDL